MMKFFRGMKRWLNFQKSINIIHNINRENRENYIIISIDAEKIFNKT